MSLEKYCCTGIGTKETICGSAKRKGGIKHAFFLTLDQTTIVDYTNAAQWTAAIANGDVVLIEEIRGEYTEVTEIENDRLIGCGSDTELDSFDHVFTWQDRAVSQANNDFYNDLNNCTGNFGWYDCQPGGTARIHVVDNVDVSFVCKPTIIEASLNSVQRYPCMAKWSSPLAPEIYNAPVGIFS